MKNIFTLISLLYFLEISSAQVVFTKPPSIPVKVNSSNLKAPWVGGLNYCQFSAIDLNFDNKKDLFVFDRTGEKVITYINNGTPNTVDYTPTEEFNSKLPKLYAWALLFDYNCDGKEDILTYSLPIAGIRVWKNTSSPGNLQFTQINDFIKSDYGASKANLYVSQVDLPALEDVDGDGDMDVLTFDFSGVLVELHKNLSVEKGYGCDSLIFQLQNGCWGKFTEDPNNCSIFLNQSCSPSFYTPPLYDAGAKHSGSCSLCLDMDNDGDKEIVLGDISCCNMTMLTNGGTASAANMNAFDAAFPSNTKHVKQSIFPCGFFVDVNNDNKRDLLVSPNLPNSSLNQKSIMYYKNTNTDKAPVFSYIQDDFLQNDMIDWGEGAYPVLFDYTGDGLQDLLISNSRLVKDSCSPTTTYNIVAYKNTGTPTQPSFEFGTNDFANISMQLPSLNDLHLTFGDLDGDKDDDMMAGDGTGVLYYFENTAGVGNPSAFTLSQSGYKDDKGNVIDVGNLATPFFVDLNRDNLLDMVIGEFGGNLNYYQNKGTAGSPSFIFVTDSLGKVNVKSTTSGYGHSAPVFYDHKGKYKLLTGSYNGAIFEYDLIDGNLSGKFKLVTSTFQNIYEGEKIALSLKDINNDTVPDMVIGNYRGGVSIWMGKDTGITSVPAYDVLSNISIYPNPSSSGIFMINSPQIHNYTANVFDALGNLILTETSISAERILDLSHVRNGIYFCKITSSDIQTTRKLSLIR